jgi:hypothetical protein
MRSGRFRRALPADEPESAAFFITDEGSESPISTFRPMSASGWPGPASAASPILALHVLRETRYLAIAGHNIMAKKTTDAKFPPSCLPDLHSACCKKGPKLIHA